MGGKPKQGEYLWTSERCYILEILNSDDYPEVSLARTRVEPGMTTQSHSLNVHEIYVIEEGSGIMYVDDTLPYEVGPGDIVSIPKNASQSIKNTGAANLVFSCVCTPRFVPESYTSLE